MNTNANNSANINNINNDYAMNANDIQFRCSDCGSKNIIAEPKCHCLHVSVKPEHEEHHMEVAQALSPEEVILREVARHLSSLPKEVVEALKDNGVYDSLVSLSTTIEEGGYIEHPKPVMRFMISQALKLVYRDNWQKMDMSKFLNCYGWCYALKVMRNELNRMAHMEANKDFEALREHSMIWTDEVFMNAMNSWIDQLNDLCKKENGYIHSCRGRKYVRVHHTDFNHKKGVFLSEWWNLMSRYVESSNRFLQAVSYKDKLEAFTEFYNETKKMQWRPKKNSKAFENAFRAAGGYYTLKDLILFEGVRLTDEDVDQLEYLKRMFYNKCGNDVATDGYKMFGYLKNVLEKSEFNFQATKKKWYEASVARREARRNATRRPRN